MTRSLCCALLLGLAGCGVEYEGCRVRVVQAADDGKSQSELHNELSPRKCKVEFHGDTILIVRAPSEKK